MTREAISDPAFIPFPPRRRTGNRTSWAMRAMRNVRSRGPAARGGLDRAPVWPVRRASQSLRLSARGSRNARAIGGPSRGCKGEVRAVEDAPLRVSKLAEQEREPHRDVGDVGERDEQNPPRLEPPLHLLPK